MMLYGKKVSKNKAIELQTDYIKDWCTWFRIEISITNRCDHAGVHFWFELMGAYIAFTFYDSRHWNEENNRYEVYDG